MARGRIVASVPVVSGAFTPLSAARLVGDFTLHNAGPGTVTVASAGAPSGFTLGAGRSLRLAGVDLGSLAARSELPAASLSVVGIFGA